MEQIIEKKRGCGYRKEGGFYAVSNGFWNECCILPLPVGACPCCGQGIKPSRSLTKVSKELLFAQKKPTCDDDYPCLIGQHKEEHFLLEWIGRSHYPTAASFIQEAMVMGISRRLKNGIPRGFEQGKTVMLLAHRFYLDPNEESPVIFAAIRPKIEYIYKEGDSDEKIKKLEERGISVIKVVKGFDVSDIQDTTYDGLILKGITPRDDITAEDFTPEENGAELKPYTLVLNGEMVALYESPEELLVAASLSQSGRIEMYKIF